MHIYNKNEFISLVVDEIDSKDIGGMSDKAGRWFFAWAFFKYYLLGFAISTFVIIVAFIIADQLEEIFDTNTPYEIAILISIYTLVCFVFLPYSMLRTNDNKSFIATTLNYVFAPLLVLLHIVARKSFMSLPKSK